MRHFQHYNTKDQWTDLKEYSMVNIRNKAVCEYLLQIMWRLYKMTFEWGYNSRLFLVQSHPAIFQISQSIVNEALGRKWLAVHIHNEKWFFVKAAEESHFLVSWWPTEVEGWVIGWRSFMSLMEYVGVWSRPEVQNVPQLRGQSHEERAEKIFDWRVLICYVLFLSGHLSAGGVHSRSGNGVEAMALEGNLMGRSPQASKNTFYGPRFRWPPRWQLEYRQLRLIPEVHSKAVAERTLRLCQKHRHTDDHCQLREHFS